MQKIKKSYWRPDGPERKEEAPGKAHGRKWSVPRDEDAEMWVGNKENTESCGTKMRQGDYLSQKLLRRVK